MISSKFRIKQERSKQLYKLLEDNGNLSRGEMVEKTGIPRSTIYKSLVPLLKSGRIESFIENFLDREKRLGRPRTIYRIVRGTQ